MSLYYLSRGFTRVHKVEVAIVLFFLIFSLVHWIKPSLVYSEDGSYRTFGVGYRQKTIVPIWFVAILIAILCYLFVLYYSV